MFNEIIKDDQLISLLNEKLKIEKRIESLLREKGFIHFSHKKFVGDLGEYYAYLNLKRFFETLKFSKNSNDYFDLIGIAKDDTVSNWLINKTVRIEVKTRYGQKGKPNIFGINLDKFDILAFVSLFDDYSIHHFCVIKKTDLPTPDKQNRIVFSPHFKTVFSTGNFIPQ